MPITRPLELDDRPLFTRGEVALLANVHHDTIRTWATAGRLRELAIGTRYLISRDEMVRLLRDLGRLA
jgi:excisionase family DNA binding protein